jgi:probable phosphoglycerate mutase
VTAAGLHGSLLLLRHGETAWTRERRVIGRQPVPLSEAGRSQSRAAAGMLQSFAPRQVVTSPLARARETAEIVAAALACPLAVDDDLAELDFGRWEGRTYDELRTDPAYLAFARRPAVSAPPGG